MTSPAGENQTRKNISDRYGTTTTTPIHITATPFVIIGIITAIGAGIAVNFAYNLPPLVLVGVAIGLILAITVIQRPELGGYILIFSVFTNLSDLFTEKGLPSINKPLVALVVLSIFANTILKTGRLSSLPKITLIDVTLIAYLLAVLGSTFVAVDQNKSLTTAFDLTKDIAVGYCIYITLDSREKIKRGIIVLLIALTFVSILGVVRKVTGTSNDFWGFAQLSQYGQVSDSDGQLRYAGAIGESNIWGQVLVSALPIILYLVINQTSIFKRLVAAGSAMFILIAMVFTESRGAYLAFAIILIFIALDLRIKSTTFLLLVSGFLLLLAVLPAKYSQRLLSLNVLFQTNQNGTTQDESINSRRAKMLIGLAMFEDNPFLGVGISNYTDRYWIYAGALGLDSSVLEVGADQTTSAQQPHSLYIEIMSETGIFGISSFLAFLGLITYRLYHARQLSKKKHGGIYDNWSLLTASILMSLLTYLIAGFFLHGIGFRFIWVLIGLALSFIRLNSSRSSAAYVPA